MTDWIGQYGGSTAHGIHILSSRLAAQRQHLTVIADNVANADTGGFKRLTFDYEQQLGRKGAVEVADYTKAIGVLADHSQGPLETTGNPFDMAILGDGYFGVETPLGTKYTRDGHFLLNNVGTLVDAQGNAVLDNGGGVIQIPAEAQEVRVLNDGTVVTDAGVLAQVGVYQFDAADVRQLNRAGNGFYAPDGVTATAALVEDVRIESGKLETSNVNPITEITRLQELNNAYQSTLRRVRALEDLEERVIRTLPAAAQ